MSIDILEDSDELAQAILSSDIFQTYLICRDKLKIDETAQKLIEEFTSWKDKYEEVQRFGKYHPDYETVNERVRLKKREMDLHPTISAFKKAERELEKLLYEVSTIIANSVSPHIKVPTGNPFFDQACGGGCGTGGGCSCSSK